MTMSSPTDSCRNPWRVYISGPMTGMPEMNAPAFAAAVERVAYLGWQPVNPHDVVVPAHDGECPPGPRFTSLADGRAHAYECFIRSDLTVLLTCDAVLLLPGWEKSRGARMEEAVARISGMQVNVLGSDSTVRPA